MDTTLFENTKAKYQQYRLINGDFLKYSDSNAYDGIVMNPPYIRQEKIDELESYGITKERLRSNPFFPVCQVRQLLTAKIRQLLG